MNAQLNPKLLDEVLHNNQRSLRQVDVTGCEPVGLEKFQVRLATALSDSVRSTFSSMCRLQVTPMGCCSTDVRSDRYPLSGIIAVSGSFKATVIVNIDEELVFSAAEGMLGMRPDAIDAEVLDLVGELANMIGGKAKDTLGVEGLTLGLPTVVAGKGHIVAYDSEAEVSFLPFECPHGSLTVEIVVA